MPLFFKYSTNFNSANTASYFTYQSLNLWQFTKLSHTVNYVHSSCLKTFIIIQRSRVRIPEKKSYSVHRLALSKLVKSAAYPCLISSRNLWLCTLICQLLQTQHQKVNSTTKIHIICERIPFKLFPSHLFLENQSSFRYFLPKNLFNHKNI